MLGCLEPQLRGSPAFHCLPGWVLGHLLFCPAVPRTLPLPHSPPQGHCCPLPCGDTSPGVWRVLVRHTHLVTTCNGHGPHPGPKPPSAPGLKILEDRPPAMGWGADCGKERRLVGLPRPGLEHRCWASDEEEGEPGIR